MKHGWWGRAGGDAGDLRTSGWGLEGVSGVFSLDVCVLNEPIMRAAAGKRHKLHPHRDKPSLFPPACPVLVEPRKQEVETSSISDLGGILLLGGHHAGLHSPSPAAAQLPHPSPGVLLPRGHLPRPGPAPHPQRGVSAAAGARGGLQDLPAERRWQKVRPHGLLPTRCASRSSDWAGLSPVRSQAGAQGSLAPRWGCAWGRLAFGITEFMLPSSGLRQIACLHGPSVKLPSDLGIFPLWWCLSGHSCARDVLQTPLESICDPPLHLAVVTEWVRWEGTSPGQLEQFVQGQLSFQYLHRWRLQQLGRAFERPGSKKVFSCVGIEFHIFLFLPVASCPVTVPYPLQVTAQSPFRPQMVPKTQNQCVFHCFKVNFVFHHSQ